MQGPFKTENRKDKKNKKGGFFHSRLYTRPEVSLVAPGKLELGESL
jgi:hypothetical protein